MSPTAPVIRPALRLPRGESLPDRAPVEPREMDLRHGRENRGARIIDGNSTVPCFTARAMCRNALNGTARRKRSFAIPANELWRSSPFNWALPSKSWPSPGNAISGVSSSPGMERLRGRPPVRRLCSPPTAQTSRRSSTGPGRLKRGERIHHGKVRGSLYSERNSRTDESKHKRASIEDKATRESQG